VLADKAHRAIGAGHAAIVDGVFADPDQRKTIAMVADSAGVAFRGIFLSTDLATRLARVGGRANDASDADAAVAKQQEGYALGSVDWSVLDASGDIAQTLRLTKSALK